VILADTSAWVEYIRGSGSELDVRVRRLIAHESELATTEPVILEVLAGARDEQQASRLQSLMLRPTLISVAPAVDFDAGAWIYRRCRRDGITPRALMDCLIAAIAARGGAALLTGDSDLRRIAGVIGLQLDFV
jgi:predicted nucleic acid-binding protein